MTDRVSSADGLSQVWSSRSSAITPREVRESLASLQSWVEQQGYRGYEPFDGLSSWARPLVCGNLLGERLLQQLIRQCPVNLRPLLGVKPKDSTKGRGYMASGYVMLYRVTKQQEYLDKALHCLEWLDKHKVQRFQSHSWSNHFDFASRAGRYTKDDPIIVWTALIGHAYIDAFEVTGFDWLLRVADSVCSWILELPRETTDTGDCISYLSHVQSSIHNANMLGAGVLARTAKHTGSHECRSVARSAMQYSCSRQRPDGSWWYAESPGNQWIDNFHTGYNLDGLKHYMDATGDGSYQRNFEAGLAFYKANFFERTGRPEVLPLANLSGGHPMCGASDRHPGLRIGRRSRIVGVWQSRWRPGRFTICKAGEGISTIGNTRC